MQACQSDCCLSPKKSLMTRAASLSEGFPTSTSFNVFVYKRFIKGKSPYSQYVLCCVLMNHYHQHNTNEKRTASVGNTKGRGLCLLCCGPLCLFSWPPQSLLHIKNGHFGCFVNQNQAVHRPPRWAGSPTFMFAENPETLLEYLKG